MQGHIRKQGKNSWSVIICTGRDPATGKYKYKWHTVNGTKKDAQAKLAELLHQMNTGAYVEPAKMTFGQYLDKWLADYVKGAVRPDTFKWYSMIVNRHLKPELGHIPLSRLSPLDLQGYYTRTLTGGRLVKVEKADGEPPEYKRTGEPLAPAMVRGHHRTIHKALEQAVKWGLVGRNVADAVDPPEVEKKEMQILEQDQLLQFLEVAKASRNYVLYLTAIMTGMRLGEVTGLRWKDVDLSKKAISVRQILKRPGPNPVFAMPKTKKSARKVAISDILAEALRQHKIEQNKEKLLLGSGYEDFGLVFAIPNGHPVNPFNLSRREFKSLLKKAGLPNVRFHDLRHTHATVLFKQNVHPKIVSERLGHSSVGITLDTYSHVLPDRRLPLRPSTTPYSLHPMPIKRNKKSRCNSRFLFYPVHLESIWNFIKIGSWIFSKTLINTGAPGRNRTCGQRIRSPLLYPLSYRRASLVWCITQAHTASSFIATSTVPYALN